MDKLKEMLDRQVTDEFKGVLTYDEIIEELSKNRETIKDADNHISALREIQKTQSIHCLILVNMMMDMGLPEPKIIQELENFIKIKEY